MSLKSVDLQNLVPKAPEVGRVQHVQDKEAQTKQYYEALKTQQKHERQRTQPPNTGKLEETRIHREKHGSSQRHRDERHEAAKKEDVNSQKGSQKGMKLDITI